MSDNYLCNPDIIKNASLIIRNRNIVQISKIKQLSGPLFDYNVIKIIANYIWKLDNSIPDRHRDSIINSKSIRVMGEYPHETLWLVSQKCSFKCLEVHSLYFTKDIIRYLTVDIEELCISSPIGDRHLHFALNIRVLKILTGGLFLETVEFGSMPNLEVLEITNTSLYRLTIKDMPKLHTAVICHNWDLAELTFDNNLNLVNLNLTNNKLTSLELSALMLETLDVSFNKLTSLDLPNAPILETLDAGFNKLEYLNISAPILETLDVSRNKLTSLELSAPILETLDVSSNKLTSLDLSNAPAINKILIGGNPWDVTGGTWNMTALIGMIADLDYY